MDSFRRVAVRREGLHPLPAPPRRGGEGSPPEARRWWGDGGLGRGGPESRKRAEARALVVGLDGGK